MNAETFTMPIHVEFAQRGVLRAESVARYGVHLNPDALAMLKQSEFDDLLQRTRKTWEISKAREIVQSWERPRFQTVEEIAISNKWGARL